MSEELRVRKAALRAQLLQRLRAQSAEERRRRSAVIAARVLALPAYAQAPVLLGYRALPYEVDTAAVLEAALRDGKQVALPRMAPDERTLAAYVVRDLERDLEPGPFGVWQPLALPERLVPPEQVALVLVPGVGFDREGRRLGHGQGYYDQFLRRVPSRVPRIGLAFAWQVLERLPATAADVPVTAVLHDESHDEPRRT